MRISLEVPSERLKRARASQDHVSERSFCAAFTLVHNDLELWLKRPKPTLNYHPSHRSTIRYDGKLENLRFYWNLVENIFYEVLTAKSM